MTPREFLLGKVRLYLLDHPGSLDAGRIGAVLENEARQAAGNIWAYYLGMSDRAGARLINEARRLVEKSVRASDLQGWLQKYGWPALIVCNYADAMNRDNLDLQATLVAFAAFGTMIRATEFSKPGAIYLLSHDGLTLPSSRPSFEIRRLFDHDELRIWQRWFN